MKRADSPQPEQQEYTTILAPSSTLPYVVLFFNACERQDSRQALLSFHSDISKR
jgi:hypothetical protein